MACWLRFERKMVQIMAVYTRSAVTSGKNIVQNLHGDHGVKPGDDALGAIDENELPWSRMPDCKKKHK
jgi:hypothetical protein